MRYTLIALKLIDVLYYIAGGFCMTRNYILIFAFIFPWMIYADCADCEAYKTQVASDCDSIVSSCDSAYFDCMTAAASAEQFAVYYASNTTESVALTHAAESCYSAGATLMTLKSFAQSIKSTAQSLQCSSNSVGGSCDCASYLQSISQHVSTIDSNLIATLSRLDSIYSSLNDGDLSVADYAYDISNSNNELMYMLQDFLQYHEGEVPVHITDFSSVTNISTYLKYLITVQKLTKAEKIALGMSSSSIQDGMPNFYRSWVHLLRNGGNNSADSGYIISNFQPDGAFGSANSFSYASLQSLIKSYYMNSINLQSSLNNYSYTNLFELIASRKSLQSVSEKFSIFNDFVFSADAPLSMYTDRQTDGSYHDYLTNYYIKVSKGHQSGSDNYTNWFSRVELLLAALVFQDEDDSTINTNGVPTESDKNSVTEIGSSLDQTISAFVQDGNSHVSSVDTSGKSIIRMVTSWNTAIGQTAKPAPFVVAEFTAPDSQSRSNISLWLDTEDERLSSLIEICHGISTLAWVAVFLLLGYNLAVYSIRVLRRLISFSFSLYSAIFGGG